VLRISCFSPRSISTSAGGAERQRLAADMRLAAPGDDEQPLVGAAMAVIRAAFLAAGSDRHLRRLGVLIFDGHPETAGKIELHALHEVCPAGA
jgi:hypothetical protein